MCTPNICFVCCSETNSGKSSTDEECYFILNQILELSDSENYIDQIPHEEITYCESCTEKIERVGNMLETLEKIERDLLEQKIDIELKFRQKNCEQWTRLTPGSSFRKEIVKDLRSTAMHSTLSKIGSKQLGRKSQFRKAPVQQHDKPKVQCITVPMRPTGYESSNTGHWFNSRPTGSQETIIPDVELTDFSGGSPPIIDFKVSVSPTDFLDPDGLPPDPVDPFSNETEEIEMPIENYTSSFAEADYGYNIQNRSLDTSETIKIIQHPLATHTTVHMLRCNECDKTFRKSINLRGHVRRVHRQEFKIRCSICKQGVRNPAELTRHMTSHSNVRNFKCHLCDKAFKYKHRLTAHLKEHR